MFHNIAHPYTAYRKTVRASCKKRLLSKVSGASIIPTLTDSCKRRNQWWAVSGY